MAQLKEDLEVSRATIKLDLQLMRDQMNAPVIWDSYDRCYRLDTSPRDGPTFMLPGLWFTPQQAYAFLTLNNMVEKIAPNVLGPFLDPMRGLLKQMLCDARFDLYRLDRRIEIDMGVGESAPSCRRGSRFTSTPDDFNEGQSRRDCPVVTSMFGETTRPCETLWTRMLCLPHRY
jgi:hypothetical protein